VGLHWAENQYGSTYPIGDSTLMAEAARIMFTALAGGKVLENVSAGVFPVAGITHPWVSTSGNKNVPAFMDVPVAVANDGARRTLLWVNDGYNPTDSSTYYPAYQCVPPACRLPCALAA